MTDSIISVEGLSKRYRIGSRRERYNTLRDSLAGAAGRLAGLLGGRGSGPASEDFWALKDVSFEVKRGEVVGVIGRNGAGKSTLLKILSRITEPTSGRAVMRGRVGSLLEVGTGFHSELTGRENVYLSGAILGMKKAEIDRKFDEIVAFSGVEKFLDTPIKRYSSGMNVRLGFAVAAHLDPEILLVDEVLAVGDAEFQKKCLGKMGEVAKGGRTVLFVSHNMESVVKLCGRGLVLDGGRIHYVGTSAGAVQGYLDAHHSARVGRCDLTRHPNRPKEMRAIVKALSLRNSDAPAPAACVKTGADMIVELDYDTGEAAVDLVQIGVNALTGQRLITVGTHLSSGLRRALKGSGTIQCLMPDVRLTPGDYTISVMVGVRTPPLNLDCVDEAMVFSVDSGNYWGTGLIPLPTQGPLAQRSEWRVLAEHADAP